MSADSYIEGVYQAHSSAVRRFLLKLGAQDEADDIVQETFERFIKHHEGLSFSGGKELAWLFQVARNIWVDRCRKNRRLTALDNEQEPAAPEIAAQSPLDLLFQEELGDRMFAIAARMDAQGQFVLLLHLLMESGVRQTEIAERLGKSERTVRRMIEKLFIQLESELRKAGVTAEAAV
ncbi:MAG: sigma-70 family RNA polymerase sigma factor [Leptospirales bacterium]|nr:sigma-70 family RNA polymerase sigma factor [Leptospirales bacterium]